MADNRRSGVLKLNIVISIVIAFIAWVFVVYNYSPMKSVTYKSVPVTYIGEEELVQRGYAIEKTSSDTVDVTLKINRKEFNTTSADDITVTADVTGCVEGPNGIGLNVVPPEDSTLQHISTSTISVDVGLKETCTIDVTPVYVDSQDQGVEPVFTATNCSSVTLEGSAEGIARAKYAVIKLDADDVGDGERPFIGTPAVVDDKGKEISHIMITPKEINCTVAPGTTKTVPLKVNISDNSRNRKSYEYPETVVIKGPTELLEKIRKIETEEIYTTGIYEDTALSISYILPEGVSIAASSLGEHIKVTVEK